MELEDRINSLEQRLVQKGRELALLKEMSLFLANSVQKTLDVFAYRVGILTNAKFVRVYLADESYKKLRLVAGHNLSDKYLDMLKGKFEISIESVPCGKAIKDRAPYIVNDITQDDFFSAWGNIASMHGYSSYIAMPLLASWRIIGAADIFFENVRYFTNDEINLLSVLFNAGALAIENTMLIENIQQKSVIDEKTGAFKYSHFVETIKKDVENARRYNQPLSVIIMYISDEPHAGSYAGHQLPENEENLKQFVLDLKNMVRGSDMVFKYHDEILCLVLAQTPRKSAADIAPRIHASFAKHFGGKKGLRTVIYSMPEDGDNLESLIRTADEANP